MICLGISEDLVTRSIHKEPIVRTPDEGIAPFLRAGLDYLSIGGFMVKAPHLEAWREAGP